MERFEFIKVMLARQELDPLAVFWYSVAFNWNIVCPKLTDDESNAIHATLLRLFGWNSPSLFKRVLSGHKVRCEWRTEIIKSTMWDYVVIDCGYGVMNCVRSNEFIKRAATYAFMCMRVYMCRDIAQMIARMVARMYLDDYKWMRMVTQRDSRGKKPYNDAMLEYKVRERIMKWL